MLNIKSARFETSCNSFADVRKTKDIPHVAFVGRSNVGKSSLINMLVRQKNLCKTSGTPGRTRLINFFEVEAVQVINSNNKESGGNKEKRSSIENNNSKGINTNINSKSIDLKVYSDTINNKFYFVDLPGYGFAAASKTTKSGWNDLIGEYLLNSKNLALVFVLLDIRQTPNENDITMLNFLQSNQIPFAVVATKCDKLSKAQLQNARTAVITTLGIGRDDIILTSSNTGTGALEIIAKVSQKTFKKQ